MPGVHGRNSDSSTTVQLAAYKASEFKASVDAASPAWTHGDEGRFEVHGDYLFGAPMAGAKVHWTVSRGRAWFTPPGAEDFAVDDERVRADLTAARARASSRAAGGRRRSTPTARSRRASGCRRLEGSGAPRR